MTRIARAIETKAMLSTSEKIRAKLVEVLNTSSLRQSDIAEACKVSKQAVQGWSKTGRIDKKHLPALAEISGKPLSWWLDAKDSSDQDPPALAVANLAKIQAVAALLSPADWDHLVATAQLLASKTTPADPQDQKAEVLPEFQSTVEQRVREAQQRREQNQQDPRPAKRQAS